MSLCDECVARKARDLDDGSSLIAAGGWCAPSPILYGFDEVGCYTVKPIPFEHFLPAHKKVNRKRALKAFKRWQRHEAMVGQMVHGYINLGDYFPEITVPRGGIVFNYGESNA